MQKVVDSNFLQDPILETYLLASKRNMAVVTDYLCMEAFKGNALVSVPKSMEILSRFPDQVVILKGTMAISALSGRQSGLLRRMISVSAHNDFKNFCRQLDEIRAGSSEYNRAIAAHGFAATEHMDAMLADAAGLHLAFRQVVEISFSPDEVSIIGKMGQYTRAIISKIMVIVTNMVARFFEAHPHGSRMPQPKELLNTFMFRYSLCSFILVLRWIEGGRQAGMNPGKVRNDIVDANFAAYGTYFDGILSKDKKLQSIYGEAHFILRALA